VGRCHGTSYRYFYNYETEKCEEFVYSGCLGNDNKFDTLDECETFCVKPHNPGAFRSFFFTFYAAVLIGSVRGFFRPSLGWSVCSFVHLLGCLYVSHRLRTRQRKDVEQEI